MSRQAVIIKREKSLLEQLVIVLVFLFLMGVFIQYFFKNEQELNKTGFENIAANFITQLSLIRGQWFMDSQPQTVFIIETDAQGKSASKRKVTVNENGWVDSEKTELACQDIWQMVMTTPLIFMREPVSAIELKRNNGEQLLDKKNQFKNKVCRYSIASGEYFEYESATGKITKTKKVVK